MHDLKFLRQHRDQVEAGIALKGGVSVDLQRFYGIEEKRLQLLHESEQLKARRNAASEEIAARKRRGETADGEIQAMREVGERIKGLDAELRRLEEESESLARGSRTCRTRRCRPAAIRRRTRWCAPGARSARSTFAPEPHWEIATELGLLDFERAPKIAGAGFLLFTGRGARLERALINFMLDLHTKHHGYTEMSPPHVIRRAALFGTGSSPSSKATCITWARTTCS
jgi:seryl-tRNA synthetase